jgi:hypothetical protein
MGNGKPLSEEVRRNLISGLRQHPTTVIFLAYWGNDAIGIANCFIGFSQAVYVEEAGGALFLSKPLINPP